MQAVSPDNVKGGTFLTEERRAKKRRFRALPVVSELQLAIDVGRQPLPTIIAKSGKTGADAIDAFAQGVRLSNHFRRTLDQATSRQAEEKIEALARREMIGPLKEYACHRDVDGLEYCLVPVVLDFDVEVHQDPHEYPRRHLHQVADGAPKASLTPIAADSTVGSEVDDCLRIVEMIRVGEQQKPGVSAGRSFVADGVDEIVKGESLEWVGYDDQLECRAENQVEKKRRRLDRMHTELRPSQHWSDALEAGISRSDHQYVLARIRHNSILTPNRLNCRIC